MLSIAGCGGSAEPVADPVAPVAGVTEPEGIVVAALGDSIVAGSPLWDPRPEARDQIGGGLDERSQFEFWAEDADPNLEFVNCGVFGERTDQIAERLFACAESATVLIIQGGINDIAQGRDPETAAANLRTMLVVGGDLGLEVAIAEVLPWNNGYPAAEKPIRQLNRLIREMAADLDVPALPFYSTLEDNRNAGRMRAEWTDDGDHPSVAGYRRLGEIAVEPLLPRP